MVLSLGPPLAPLLCLAAAANKSGLLLVTQLLPPLLSMTTPPSALLPKRDSVTFRFDEVCVEVRTVLGLGGTTGVGTTWLLLSTKSELKLVEGPVKEEVLELEDFGME